MAQKPQLVVCMNCETHAHIEMSNAWRTREFSSKQDGLQIIKYLEMNELIGGDEPDHFRAQVAALSFPDDDIVEIILLELPPEFFFRLLLARMFQG